MDQSLLANRSSELLQSLGKLGLDDVHQDNIARNLPPCVKTVTRVVPRLTGGTYMFDFPESGFLTNAFLEIIMTSSDDNRNIEELLGTRVFKKISLKQNNRVIQSLTPEYILSRIDQEKKEKRDALNWVCNPDDDWNNNSVKVHTPLFFNIFESPGKNYLLQFTKNVELECELYDDEKLLDPLVYKLAVSPVLVCNIMNYEQEYYEKYMMENLKAVFMPIQSLSYDIHCDEIDINSGTTFTKLYLTSRQLVQSIHIVIKNTTNNSLWNINSFNIWANGQKIVDTTPQSLLFDTGFVSGSGDVNHLVASKPLVQYFSRYKSHNEHTGGLNFKNFSDDKYIEVHYPTIGSGYRLYVICEYLTVCSMNSFGHIHRNFIS